MQCDLFYYLLCLSGDVFCERYNADDVFLGLDLSAICNCSNLSCPSDVEKGLQRLTVLDGSIAFLDC